MFTNIVSQEDYGKVPQDAKGALWGDYLELGSTINA